MLSKKSLGQNFLIDKEAINIVVRNIDSKLNTNVIEIGGGYGAISSEICNNLIYKKYTIFEIDSYLAENLKLKLEKSEKVNVKNEDFLKADIKTENTIIFGSIPYFITSPIIHKILESEPLPVEIILIIQKEVADKILAENPKATYWTYLTFAYDKKRLKNLKSNSFKPAPKVDSTILKLSFNEKKYQKISDIEFQMWKEFLRYTYKFPRKMLNKRFDKKTLTHLGITPTNRPHDLDIEQILSLYLYKSK